MHRYATVLIAMMSLSACAQAEPAPAHAPAQQAAAAAAVPADASARPAAIDDTEPDVTRQVSAILEKVRAGLLAPDDMTENARTAYPASQLQRMARALRPCSKPPVLELLARTTKGEDRNYRYRALCPTPLMVEIVFNKGGRISHLSVAPETAPM